LLLYGRAVSGCCKPNVDRTRPITIFESLKDNFIELFGEAAYNAALTDIMAGRDAVVPVPDNVIRSFEEEMEWERKKMVPLPRTKRRD